MNKKLLLSLVIVILLIAVVPNVHSLDATAVPIDDTAPFWARLFSTFLFTGTQADLNCRSTWECVKDSNGLYRYDCYADASFANGCPCYRTTDPSKCNTGGGTTTPPPPSGTSGGTSCTDALGKTIASGSWGCTGLAKATCNSGAISYQLNAPECASTVTQVSCSDSDGGTDYLKRGIVTWTGSAGNKITYDDKCYSAYVLTEWDCSGTSPVGNSVSCPNGCSNGACSGTPPVTTVVCNLDDYQCSGTKVQKCVSGSLQSTYWTDWLDCGQNQCTTAITGSPVCPSTGPTPTPSPGPTPTNCIAEGGFNGPGGDDCCAGLMSGFNTLGICILKQRDITDAEIGELNADSLLVTTREKLLLDTECVSDSNCVNNKCTTFAGAGIQTNIITKYTTSKYIGVCYSGKPTEECSPSCSKEEQCVDKKCVPKIQSAKSSSLTFKEWSDTSAAQRIKTLCKTKDDCEAYSDVSGTEKEYSVSCNAARTQSKLQEDVDNICKSTGNDKYLAIGGGATGAVAGCAGGALLAGAATAPLAGLGAIPGCIAGAVFGSTVVVTTVEGFHNTLQINCKKNTVPSDVGACIAVPKGGSGTFDWLTETHDIFGQSIPTWGIAAGILLLFMILPALLGGKK